MGQAAGQPGDLGVLIDQPLVDLALRASEDMRSVRRAAGSLALRVSAADAGDYADPYTIEVAAYDRLTDYGRASGIDADRSRPLVPTAQAQSLRFDFSSGRRRPCVGRPAREARPCG